MRICSVAVLAVGATIVAQPAGACEYDPFLFQLPGETIQAAQVRSNRIMSDSSVIRSVDRQNYDFDKAQVVYLGRKLTSVDDPKTRGRLTIVHPVHAIRGVSPRSDRTLRIDAMMGGICGGVGDGDIAHLPPGSYVVVFEGLPHDENRPRGIDSFDVNDIRNDKLLDALRSFGKDLED